MVWKYKVFILNSVISSALSRQVFTVTVTRDRTESPCYNTHLAGGSGSSQWGGHPVQAGDIGSAIYEQRYTHPLSSIKDDAEA